MFESILGVLWVLTSGHIAPHALLSITGLQSALPPDCVPHRFPSRFFELQPVSVERRDRIRHLVRGLERLEERIGYRFQHPELLVEAFTHPSFSEACTPCYQRLEHLGDAALDLMIANFYFEKFPNYGPSRLSSLRQAAANNQVMAFMARDCGFPAYILHDSPGLMSELTRWISEQDLGDSVFTDESPKAVSDVLEALAGAILIDAGFEVMRSIMLPLMMPRMIRHAFPDSVDKSPRRMLESKCRMAGLCVTFTKLPSDPNDSLIFVSCEVNGEVLATCSASKKSVAEMRSAAVALSTARFPVIYEAGLQRVALTGAGLPSQ